MRPGHTGGLPTRGETVRGAQAEAPAVPKDSRAAAISVPSMGDGFLQVTDRLKELIKVNGYQLAPSELEGLLLLHANIADAAVIGIPGVGACERPKAFIVTSQPATEEEVDTCVETQAHYRRLKEIVLLVERERSDCDKTRAIDTT